MPKFNRVLSTLLVTAIMFSGLFTAATQTTRAQTNPSRSWENVFKKFFDKNEDNQPPVPPAPGGGTSRSWENIFQDYDPPVPPNAGGSRGGLCVIAPQPISTNTEVWSDRPVFVWRGMLSRIEIRPTGSNQVLWHQTGIEGLSSVLYAGEALQPGQTYDWLLFDQFATKDSSPIRQVTFRVMDAKQRDRIKMQLQNLEAELKAKGASAEDIAMERARYFTQQKLWSDVLHEAYSVKNPSAALAKLIQDLPTQLCSKASR
jgi:hypothetical protein